MVMSTKKIIIYLLIAFSQITYAQEQGAKFVWLHDNANVRNEYVYFRNDFVLEENASKAEINLYVDSRYQLFVNEVFINFGPARAYPENAEFDTHDISPFLKVGKNTIAIKALYNGIESFQIPNNRPGFISWGNVESNSIRKTLETPGNWVCKKSLGYDQYAVRFSFACAAMEVFDATKEEYYWNSLELLTTDWVKPIITDQNAWNKLNHRSIPPLTQNEKTAKQIVGIYKLNNDEDLYQFRIKTPDEKTIDYNNGRHVLGYTYIYSPNEQSVEIGLWWGEFYLNGDGPLKGLGENPNRINRDPRIFKLKKGWNFLNIHYGAIWGAWDFYMAIPKTANLQLSPVKKLNSDVAFMTAGYFEGEMNKKLKEFDRPFDSAQEILGFYKLDWKEQLKNSKTNNPALDMVWNYADEKVSYDDWQTENIKVETGPGTSLVYDLGGKTLGRMFIEIEAPAGTIIDMGISEDLYNGKAWIFKRKMISGAARFISDGNTKRFETFKPYGFKFIQVNITNNTEPAIIKKVGVVEQVYPFEKMGLFECSDPMLNAIWEIGWRTLRVCSEDSYIDTPFRERGLYAGDMLPEYAITLATSGDSRLLKRSLKYFQDQYRDAMFNEYADKQGDFPLINIISSKWYFDYTGDKELIEIVYEGYKSLMQKWAVSQNEKGIMSTGKQFIEWTRIDKSAKLTATHALLSEALKIMADYAEVLNEHNDAQIFMERSNEVSKSVETKFWNAEKQLFNDGFKDDTLAGKYYPTSNAWPLLFRCTNQEQTKIVLKYLEVELDDIGEQSRNRRLTPYSAFYVLAALYQNGKAELAEKFIKKYWTRMILNGDDTTWENFDIAGENDGGGQGTASHAWSGHPTYFLTTEALGVNLGFHKEFDRDKIIISPQTSTLSWARGRVPHPAGIINVDWRIDGDQLFIDYQCENEVDIIIKPRGRLADLNLWINGQRVSE